MLSTARSKRVCKLIFLISTLAIAAFFILTALQQQVQLYLTPSDFWRQFASQHNKQFKIGGLVKHNSIKFNNENVEFVVTDLSKEVKVIYHGILPALFKENKGVVLTGVWEKNHILATQVLAKHDENYTPPGIHLGD